MNRRAVMVIVSAMMLIAGCAPKGLENGLGYYADQYRVRDAASRRVQGYWYLRCNDLALSDLDDALEAGKAGQPEEMRRLGIEAVQAAADLAREVGQGEIVRLPAEGRAQLARSAGLEEAQLQEAQAQRVQVAAEALVTHLQKADARELQSSLASIRRAVEALPDDQGRAGRQTLLALAALPAWAGVASIEQSTEAAAAGEFKPFEHSEVFVPANPPADTLLARYAPAIVLETRDDRGYPAEFDRFGAVRLAGAADDIEVQVDTSRPTVYGYTSQAKINGTRRPQLVYVWWFPERPSMTKHDPAAGRIDGDTLRLTLDPQNRPAVFEVVQGCGCGHLVYVAEDIERRARNEFGPPEKGKRLSVERDVHDKRDLIVSGTVRVPANGCRPLVYARAGVHAIAGVSCDAQAISPAGSYVLDDYDRLDHLPLGDGFASMFGPDGLVHNAGRREGYLLAPTGILSAGQPRQRGTQKIRWDEYSFEDPRLLEKTLRLPSDF